MNPHAASKQEVESIQCTEYVFRNKLAENKSKCFDRESNTGPSDLQSDALPTELSKHVLMMMIRDDWFHFFYTF
jgi:hypothetical protein